MHIPSTIMGRSPQYVYLVVQASIGFIISFGLNLSGEMVASIMFLTIALISFLTNQQFTPNSIVESRVEEALNTPVPVKPAGE